MSADTGTPDDGPVGGEGRALLDAARAGLEPSEADRTRVRRSLAAAIAAGAAAATAGATGSAAASATAASVPLGVKLALAAALLAATGAGIAYVEHVVVRERDATRRNDAPVARSASSAALPGVGDARGRVAAPPAAQANDGAASVALDRAPAAAAATNPPADARTTRVSAPHARATSAPSLHATSDERPAQPSLAALSDELPAETALLRRAHAALAAPSAESARAALEALDEHARRFPTGTLAEERDATRAIALCAAGRVDDASTAARTFLAAHPGSPLAHRVRTVCTQPPAPH